MTKLLEDSLNIQLLKLVCSGQGVDVNISKLAEVLGKHRNTIQSRFEKILQHEIIDPPFLPFHHLLNELPLLVIEKIDLSRDPKTNLWIEIDPNIWAAFFFKEEEFNTLMIEMHRDLYEYQIWKERVINEKLISAGLGTDYIPSESFYLSTKAILKYDPSASIKIFRENFERRHHTKINGLELDAISVDILEILLSGKGIQTNPNILAKSLNVHRKTVQRRLDLLMKENIILPPVCRFPRIWTPPEYFLVISLIEIKKNKARLSKILSDDPHVSMLLRANVGRYNLLAFNSFYRIDDHLVWQEEYDQRFTESFGAVKNFYLSPTMTFAINQQYTALAYLDAQSDYIRGKELMKFIK